MIIPELRHFLSSPTTDFKEKKKKEKISIASLCLYMKSEIARNFLFLFVYLRLLKLAQFRIISHRIVGFCSIKDEPHTLNKKEDNCCVSISRFCLLIESGLPQCPILMQDEGDEEIVAADKEADSFK